MRYIKLVFFQAYFELTYHESIKCLLANENFSVFSGILFDQLGNYTLAFILAGIPPILGAFLMCLIYKIKSPEPERPQPSNLENATLPSGEALVPSQTATTVLSEQLVVETESLLKPQGNFNFSLFF